MFWNRKSVKKVKKWCLVALLMVFLVAWVAGVGVAQEDPAILPINPVPGIQTPDILNNIKVREGTIHRVGDGVMVISDVTRRLAPAVRYLSGFMGPEKSPQAFKDGAYVGFRLNDKREIAEIWLIK
jgi:hypothetical protein